MVVVLLPTFYTHTHKIFKIEGKVQVFFFLDKPEIGQFIVSRPALQKMEKKVLGAEGKYTVRNWYLNPGMKNTRNRKRFFSSFWNSLMDVDCL